jgi:NAD(P)-dependent dehydrogenase (short-subunit alcohol dehydrogenase family)
MKAAVTSLTRTLAVELAPENIRVNSIAPDIVPTEGMQGASGLLDMSAAGDTIRRIGIPMGRLGRYEDIGSSVLFLASGLSSYITGTTLHPDGGVFAASGWLNWPETGWSPYPPP